MRKKIKHLQDSTTGTMRGQGECGHAEEDKGPSGLNDRHYARPQGECGHAEEDKGPSGLNDRHYARPQGTMRGRRVSVAMRKKIKYLQDSMTGTMRGRRGQGQDKVPSAWMDIHKYLQCGWTYTKSPGMMRTAIVDLQMQNQAAVTHIIFYRDGVSEGEYDQVKSIESAGHTPSRLNQAAVTHIIFYREGVSEENTTKRRALKLLDIHQVAFIKGHLNT
ncbi:hypothetical protein DFP72DRAFT_861645 [Ephemerocybe angulata]|uniref:Piwi domain-containing protein n=1 Tax=Ephemerocybe angulata TaxID=980116 RepID=A0A8H6H786_9AGAR|nr:hypothetical protein DFP72DRAFT_861645 [Tulosesus angulatus]